MNVFETHSKIVKDYATYIRSFLNIADPKIREVVEDELSRGKLWPEPLLQFNPSFEFAGNVSELSKTGVLHPDIAAIFKGYSLYCHQVEAIKLGIEEGKDFIVTSGTGSGKSLTYIGPIFHHLLENPAYHPIVIPYRIEDGNILIIWVPGGPTRPYKAKLKLGKTNKDYGYFIRKGSSTVRAKGPDETELLSLAATVPFDDRLNQRAGVEDLSRELMRDFLLEVGSDLAADAFTLPLVELGRRMHIISGPEEAPFPLNVGLLFFNPEPHRFFPVTQIDVVWFPDGPGGDKFTEKIFRGPLPRMIREALDYIRRNYLNETVIKHPDRAEATRVDNFPYEAIEEAVVNAVYHRSYEEREPVEVRITPEDLVVLSYPGPDRSVRLEQLRMGRAVPRRYRNRRIGEFLKELDLTEGRATGIPKILRAMKDNGSPPPEFDFDEDHTYFLVRLPVHLEARMDVEPDAGKITLPVTPPVTPPVMKLLSLLAAKGPKGNADIRKEFGLKDRTHLRKLYIDPALSTGLIEYTIPGKPTSRMQKYRLTDKGRACLTGEWERQGKS